MRLEARHLSKSFGECKAVTDVTLDFAPGLIHAVLGENGAGKSTLMKLFFGLYTPSAGEILLDGQIMTWRSSLDAIANGLGMVQQHFTLVETLSVIDNIMLGSEVCASGGRLRREQAIAMIEQRLPSHSLALPWHETVSRLSVGQKQRLEILKLLFRDSTILFLDEPTAVLTPQEIEEFFQVLRQLKAQGRTIILITHKINEVLALCDTYSVLRAGQVVARGHVKGIAADEIVHAMIGRKIAPLEDQRPLQNGPVVLNVRQVNTGRLRGASLDVRSGEIVGIAGVEGSGQAELIDVVMGLCQFEGQVEVLGQAVAFGNTKQIRGRGASLIPEDRQAQGLWLEESCYMNMALGLEKDFFKSEILQEKALQSATSRWAKDFDVRASSLDLPVGALSGGNQQKIIFAREVSGHKPKLLLCHQPTRGVDLGAIDLIHRRLIALRNQGVGLLVISSELDELFALCDRILVFFAGRAVAEFSRSQFNHAKIGSAMTGATHV